MPDGAAVAFYQAAFGATEPYALPGAGEGVAVAQLAPWPALPAWYADVAAGSLRAGGAP